MAIVQSLLCDKIGENIDKLLDKLDSVEDAVREGINGFKDILSSMSWSTPQDLLNAAANVLDNAGSLLPDLSEWDDVLNTMLGCEFLSDQYGSPTAAVNSLKDDYLGKTADGITDLAGGLPEFSAARAFDALTNQVQTSKVNADVSAINKGLTCLQNICGLDVTDKTTRLNGFLGNCKLDGNGNPSMDQIMSDAGITDPDKIANMNRASSTFSNVKQQASDKIDQGKSVVKLLSKTSNFF